MIIEYSNLDIGQIADSGQCFRMNQIGDKRYSLIAYEHYIELTQVDQNVVELTCGEEEFEQIWKNYFDLSYDYKGLTDGILEGNDQFLKDAVTYGNGIRVLQQEPFEMVISFIISQNKNIPAIKRCVEMISEKYGERKITSNGVIYYTFPQASALVKATKEELRELKTGYRDQYIMKASEMVYQGKLDLESLKKCSFQEAAEALKTVPGIGDKVASCVALFGLHHIEAFPIDVWIKRILKEVYQDNFPLEMFEGYAGLVQQYMFYYMRSIYEK